MVKIYQWLIMICIFLSALNFYNYYSYFLFISFILLLMIPSLKIRVNTSSFFLLLLGFSMLLFDPYSQRSLFGMLRALTYVFSYTLGFSFIRSGQTYEKKGTQFKQMLTCVVGGTFLYYLLNLTASIGRGNRNISDIWWSTDVSFAATRMACLACMATAVSVAIFFAYTKFRWKIAAFGLAALIIVYNFWVLAGRTLPLLMLCVIIVAFCFRCHEDKNKTLRNILLAILFVILLVVAFNFNFLGMKTAFEHSSFYDRFFGKFSMDINYDKRTSVKLWYLRHMVDYRSGGSVMSAVRGVYAHDLYLDSYNLAGPLALFGVVCYIIASLSRLKKVLKSKVISYNIKQVILCLYTAINIQFFLEPIIQGVPWLLAFYCIIDGMVTYFLLSAKDDREPKILRNKAIKESESKK